MLPSFTGAIPISPLQTKELHRRSDDPKSTDVISVYGLVITTIGVLIAAIGVFGWKRWRGRREVRTPIVRPCRMLTSLVESRDTLESVTERPTVHSISRTRGFFQCYRQFSDSSGRRR